MKVGCDGSPAQVSCPGCTLWKTAIIPSLDVIFPPVTLYTFYSLATVFFSTSLIFRRVLCLLIWLKYFTHLFFFLFLSPTLFIPRLFRSSVFDRFCFYEIQPILLYVHIPNLSKSSVFDRFCFHEIQSTLLIVYISKTLDWVSNEQE